MEDWRYWEWETLDTEDLMFLLRLNDRFILVMLSSLLLLLLSSLLEKLSSSLNDKAAVGTTRINDASSFHIFVRIFGGIGPEEWGMVWGNEKKKIKN